MTYKHTHAHRLISEHIHSSTPTYTIPALRRLYSVFIAIVTLTSLYSITSHFPGPESVQSLSVVTAEENITLTWNKPVDHKPSYHYYVIWINSGLIISNTSTLLEDLIIDQLVPGSLYNFTVTTETADGTKGAPVSNSICTSKIITCFTCFHT